MSIIPPTSVARVRASYGERSPDPRFTRGDEGLPRTWAKLLARVFMMDVGLVIKHSAKMVYFSYTQGFSGKQLSNDRETMLIFQ